MRLLELTASSIFYMCNLKDIYLIRMMFNIPKYFPIIFIPLPNAIILRVISISVFIDFIFRWQVPNSDWCINWRREYNSPVICMRSGDSKDRSSVSSQSDIRLDISFSFWVILINIFEIPQFDSAIFWDRGQRVDFLDKKQPIHIVIMRLELVFRLYFHFPHLILFALNWNLLLAFIFCIKLLLLLGSIEIKPMNLRLSL